MLSRKATSEQISDKTIQSDISMLQQHDNV